MQGMRMILMMFLLALAGDARTWTEVPEAGLAVY